MSVLGSLLRVCLFSRKLISRRIDLNSNRKQSIYRLLLECQCRSGILILLTIGVFFVFSIHICRFVMRANKLKSIVSAWKSAMIHFIWLKMFIFLFVFLSFSCLFIFSVWISPIIAQMICDRSDPTRLTR